MANPVMKNLGTQFEQRTPAGYPTMPGYQPGRGGATPSSHDGGYPQGNYQGPQGNYQAPQQTYYQDQQQAYYQDQQPGQMPMGDYEQAYASQSADAVDRGRMTYDDVIMKTGAMFGVLLLAAVVSWVATLTVPGAAAILMFGGLIGGFVLAMVNIFSKKISPALIVAYSAAEGLVLGSISAIFEVTYPGIVVQAALATFAVMGVALALFASGKIRNTSKARRFVLIGLISLLVYNLVSMILVWTGLIANPWGISGMTVLGIPIGVLVGAFAVVLGTFSLIGDYDIAKQGVEMGAPKIFAWRVAFGIMVTVVWMYMEILRLIAILRSN
ncbi:MAG TPA: Bax inhibitor-1/YccA family protein [Actinomyces sp.]|nr:Bax inhibitor-1/YccA family protein [Actinomyces sp.]